VATPALSVPVPMEVPLSRKVTVPVGVPDPGAEAETVAVKVTDWPKTEGLAEEVTVVVVFDLFTVRLAFAVVDVPPGVEVTCTLLFLTPIDVPVTFSDTVQLAKFARLPPDKLAEPDPATAVAVPLQVLLRLLGVATTTPAGKVSVNATAVSVPPVPGLLMVNVSEDVALKTIVVGEKAFATVSVMPPTVKVKDCMALDPTPLLAVMVRG